MASDNGAFVEKTGGFFKCQNKVRIPTTLPRLVKRILTTDKLLLDVLHLEGLHVQR